MNRILNYINDTLISLDIPPIARFESKKSDNKIREISGAISSKAFPK